MKLKSSSFKCKKLLKNPCRGILQIFKFRFKKPLFIRCLMFNRKPRPTQTNPKRTTPRPPKKLASGLRSLLGSLRSRSREMDRLMALKSFSDVGTNKAPHPSPLTPAYVRMSGANMKDLSGPVVGEAAADQEEVEDACRSFENYMVEMIVDEGKLRDLMDVEELLHCWKDLKSPVFIDLVCRFYGELWKDLFSNGTSIDHEEEDSIKTL